MDFSHDFSIHSMNMVGGAGGDSPVRRCCCCCDGAAWDAAAAARLACSRASAAGEVRTLYDRPCDSSGVLLLLQDRGGVLPQLLGDGRDGDRVVGCKRSGDGVCCGQLPQL